MRSDLPIFYAEGVAPLQQAHRQGQKYSYGCAQSSQRLLVGKCSGQLAGLIQLAGPGLSKGHSRLL